MKQAIPTRKHSEFLSSESWASLKVKIPYCTRQRLRENCSALPNHVVSGQADRETKKHRMGTCPFIPRSLLGGWCESSGKRWLGWDLFTEPHIPYSKKGSLLSGVYVLGPWGLGECSCLAFFFLLKFVCFSSAWLLTLPGPDKPSSNFLRYKKKKKKIF